MDTLAPCLDAALAAQQADDWEQALTCWRLARVHDPHDSRIVQATARCLRRLGQHRDAEVLLNQQLWLQPEALPLQLAVLEGLADAGQWQSLLAAIAPLLAALPDDPALKDLLAQAADHLQPEVPQRVDWSAGDLHASLLPWLPQRLLLVCSLAGTSDLPFQRLAAPVQPTPAALAALLPAVPPGEQAVVAPAQLAQQLPVWSELIRQRGLNASVVLICLHPLLAVPELQQREGLSVDDALDHWCHQQLLAERHSRNLPRQRLNGRPGPAQLQPRTATAADPARLDRALALHKALQHPDDDHCRREADRLVAGPATSNDAEVAQRLSIEAQAAADSGELDLAVVLYRQAIAQMPAHCGLYPALARCLRRLDRAAEAEALLSRHLSEQPESAPGWIGLAEGEREQGRWRAALAHYACALQLDPDHGGLPRAIANTAERLLPPGDGALALPTAELLRFMLPQLPQRLLLVLGMHRSGTSALSGLLCQTGFQAPINLDSGTVHNPTGFWEPRQLRAFHDKLLESAQSSWEDPLLPVLEWQPRNLEMTLLDLERAMAADFSTTGPHTVALIKEPRQCRLQSIWNAWLHQSAIHATVVLAVRQPAPVVASLVERDQLPVDRALLLWLTHTLEAERVTRHLPRIVVSYDQLLHNPGTVVERCQELAGLPICPPSAGLLTEWIRPSLNRHQNIPHEPELKGDSKNLLDWANAVYSALADPTAELNRGILDHAHVVVQDKLYSLLEQGSRRVTAQLYWVTEDGNSFSEEASQRRSVMVQRGRARVVFILPNDGERPRLLRLDLAKEPASVTVLGIRIRLPGGSLLWQWPESHVPTPQELLAVQDVSPGTLVLQGGVVIASTTEPGVVLDVPVAVLQQLEVGTELELEALWQPLPPGVAMMAPDIAKTRLTELLSGSIRGNISGDHAEYLSAGFVAEGMDLMRSSYGVELDGWLLSDNLIVGRLQRRGSRLRVRCYLPNSERIVYHGSLNLQIVLETQADKGINYMQPVVPGVNEFEICFSEVKAASTFALEMRPKYRIEELGSVDERVLALLINGMSLDA